MRIVSSQSIQSYKYKVLKSFFFTDPKTKKYRASIVGETIVFDEKIGSDIIIGLCHFKKLLPEGYEGVVECVVIHEISMPVNQKMEIGKVGEVIRIEGFIACPLVCEGKLRPTQAQAGLWQPGRLSRPKLPDRSTTFGKLEKEKPFAIDYDWKVKRK